MLVLHIRLISLHGTIPNMVFFVFACFCVAVVLFLVFLMLFEPALKYSVTAPDCAIDSGQFRCLLGAVCDTQVHPRGQVEVLTEGAVFYEAELEAIRQAKQSVHLEAFLFTPGAIAERFVEALTERAMAGVKVRVVLDWIGSFPCPDRYFDNLRQAGGVVAWYQPLRWYTFKRFNNRTHRELLIIDGKIGFIGGAGIANHWMIGDGDGRPPWRDMMCRARGGIVAGLQTTFAENWLEATGQILDVASEFPDCGCDHADASNDAGSVAGLVVISAPTAGRATRARILFQILLAASRKSMLINSPYFLPDHSARAELVKARQRGVAVTIITPGINNHPLARRASRRIYGELLRSGIEIFEYQPGMIHKKCLVIDDVWSVVGSTNFDTRSFGLNDEVNLAAADAQLAAKLKEEFEIELSRSRRISYEEWTRRPLWERGLAMIGQVFERQE